MTRKLGRAAFDKIDGGVTTPNSVAEDRTISSGDTHTHGTIDIGTGKTWTVDSGGSLISFITLTVSGTGVLINNGTAIAIS